MYRPSRLIAVSLLLALVGATSIGSAETVNCIPITTVPTTITTQGVYCLTQHITTAIAAGRAIDIAANNVVLDLNGYKLQGQAAGPGTQAQGIVGLDQKNITIKNGTVRGFLHGMFLRGSGHIVEDMRVDLSTSTGINIIGVGSVVRNNLVTATGGTTIFGSDASASGIEARGALHRMLNNEVLDTFPVGTGFSPSRSHSSGKAGKSDSRLRRGRSVRTPSDTVRST